MTHMPKASGRRPKAQGLVKEKGARAQASGLWFFIIHADPKAFRCAHRLTTLLPRGKAGRSFVRISSVSQASLPLEKAEALATVAFRLIP